MSSGSCKNNVTINNSLTNHIYIYIYIYIDGERERVLQ